MVVLHELAHIRRRHLPQRLAALVPVWAVAMGVTRVLAGVPLADVAGIVAGLLASLAALRWIAYRTEFDADRCAVELAMKIAGKVEGVPGTVAEAGKSLASALMVVTIDHPQSRQASWMHPSIEERCRRLGDSV
jgi:Zn-dependent protease with chaperone function